MDDPARKTNKLQVLSYIDDFIQNNVKVLENPRYTDIGEYHKLMEKIKSKMVYPYESCGTETPNMRKSSIKEPVKDSVTNTVSNSLSDVSCTSVSISKNVALSNKRKEIVNCSTSKLITVKEELPEIRTEVFGFNPNEHGICATENYCPQYVQIKSDNSHNIYKLHNDNNLLQIVSNDNETQPVRNMIILHKLLTKNTFNATLGFENDSINNRQIKRDTLLIKEDMTSDCESNINELTEIKNSEYDSSLIKDESTQLRVQTDLAEQLLLENNSSSETVKMENNSTDTCEFISSKNYNTLPENNSKKQVYVIKKKVPHKKKYTICLKSTFTSKPKFRKYYNIPRKRTKFMKRKSTEKNKEEEITIKNCSVSLVKVEDELLHDSKLKPDLLLRDTDSPMFNKLLLQDMMNISAGKQLTFFSPENVNVLIDKLNQENVSSDEIILFLNTNDVVTKMYMDHFPQLETAILGNKVKVIDKTVADIYTRVQGVNVFFDTYVQQKLNTLAVHRSFGMFKKNILRDLK